MLIPRSERTVTVPSVAPWTCRPASRPSGIPNPTARRRAKRGEEGGEEGAEPAEAESSDQGEKKED